MESKRKERRMEIMFLDKEDKKKFEDLSKKKGLNVNKFATTLIYDELNKE